MTSEKINPNTFYSNTCPLTGLRFAAENPLASIGIRTTTAAFHPIFSAPAKLYLQAGEKIRRERGEEITEQKRILIIAMMKRMNLLKLAEYLNENSFITMPGQNLYYTYRDMLQIFDTWTNFNQNQKQKFNKHCPKFAVNTGEENKLIVSAIIPGLADSISFAANSQGIKNKMSEIIEYTPDRKAVIRELIGRLNTPASIENVKIESGTKGSHYYMQKFGDLFFELNLKLHDQESICIFLANHKKPGYRIDGKKVSTMVEKIQSSQVVIDYLPDQLELLNLLKHSFEFIKKDSSNSLDSLFGTKLLTSEYEKQTFSIEIINYADTGAKKNDVSFEQAQADKEKSKRERLLAIIAAKKNNEDE